jgi:hypothetical protein
MAPLPPGVSDKHEISGISKILDQLNCFFRNHIISLETFSKPSWITIVYNTEEITQHFSEQMMSSGPHPHAILVVSEVAVGKLNKFGEI